MLRHGDEFAGIWVEFCASAASSVHHRAFPTIQTMRVQWAMAAVRTRKSQLGILYRWIEVHRGHAEAMVAPAETEMEVMTARRWRGVMP